jgi:hypothetical protein
VKTCTIDTIQRAKEQRTTEQRETSDTIQRTKNKEQREISDTIQRAKEQRTTEQRETSLIRQLLFVCSLFLCFCH